MRIKILNDAKKASVSFETGRIAAISLPNQ